MHYYLVILGGLFFFFFSGNVKIFSYLVEGLKQHSREYYIPKNEFHPLNIITSLMGIQHSHGKRMFTIVKRPKYPLLPPKAARHRSPSTACHHHHCCQTPSAAVVTVGQLVATASIKGIFGNLSNIPRNSICIPNTYKISYPEKLLPKIAFLGILFPAIKIHSVYQALPRVSCACRWQCDNLS